MYRVQMDHLPVWHYPPQAAGVGYGQGTADVIEWMGALNPSKWAKQVKNDCSCAFQPLTSCVKLCPLFCVRISTQLRSNKKEKSIP
jgi:hypothetical protein